MTGTKLKSQGEAFNSWIKDPHFQDQLKRLTACSINFDYMPIYPINEQIAVDLLWDEIKAKQDGIDEQSNT